MTKSEIDVVRCLINVAKEIAHDSTVDLVYSERRIRLYYALEQCGQVYQSWNIEAPELKDVSTKASERNQTSCQN